MAEPVENTGFQPLFVCKKFSPLTTCDEFPQFLNVLKGDMSAVGTRPPTVGEWKEYDPHHRARLSMKPGITGLWQVSGRSNITDFEEVVRLDVQYIRTWSLINDFKILCKTVKVVLSTTGGSMKNTIIKLFNLEPDELEDAQFISEGNIAFIRS